MRALLCLLLLCMASLSVQRSTPEDSHYVAAVLEYHPDSDTQTNLENYAEFIRQAADQDADIVVFPEMTLTRGTALPVPIRGLLKQHPIPALAPDLYDNILVQLSRSAREHQIYVLVNVQEEMDCTTSPPPAGEECPGSLVYRFNTNVVFDRSGSVIDRYRKINLFGEYTRTPSLDSQLGVFTTDFGVTFGHFICFDLMFQVPAIQVVQKLNITNVILSTMWFSEMPFLTAVEIQQAYAYANNVNFLASGANNVAVGSAGSGIYSGKAGALISTMPGVTTRKLLVSKVPKIPGKVEGMVYPGALPNDPKTQDALLLKRDVSLPAHVTRVIQETEELQQFQLRDGDVSCSFRIRLRDLDSAGEKEHYHYRAVIQDDGNTYAARYVGVSACAFVACLTHDVKSCALRSSNTSSRYEISELQISMISHKPKYNESLQCDDAFYHPLSLKIDKYPLAPENFTYNLEDVQNNKIYHEEKEHIRQKATMALVTPQQDLLTMAVWGRIYGRDTDRRDEIDEAEKQKFEEFENSLSA